MANQLFSFLASYLEVPTDRLLLSFNSHDKEKKTMSVSVSVLNKDELPIVSPLVIRGTYDELNGRDGLWATMMEYKAKVLPFGNNLSALEEEVKKAEKKHQDALKKAKAPVKVAQNRCEGGCNEEMALYLVSDDIQSDEYKKSLEGANLRTILSVLDRLTTTPKEKSRFNKLSSELKKITGSNADGMGITYDPTAKPESTEAEGEEKVKAPAGLFTEFGLE